MSTHRILSAVITLLLLLTAGASAHYDPVVGRWLSPDPVGHAGSFSLYDYCDNDPVNQVDPDGRFGKGVVSGWNGSIAANAPNSGSFSAGMTLGAVFSGGAGGFGQGVQNVSGYTSYQEHLTVFGGDKWAAGNAAWNPAYVAMRGFTEAGTGSGLQPHNLGQTLTGGQRVWSGVEGTLGAVGTVGTGVSTAALTRSVGLTGPTMRFSRSSGFGSPIAGDEALGTTLHDPSLYGVRLTTAPTFNPTLPADGLTIGRGAAARVEIGPSAFSSRENLLNTIIHEETHIRLDLRTGRGSHRADLIQSARALEESYVESVADRFMRRFGDR